MVMCVQSMCVIEAKSAPAAGKGAEKWDSFNPCVIDTG